MYLGIGLGEVIYLVLGFFIQPQPNIDNMGWFGGLINNPFRITDNFNRFIFFLKLLLLPGRFMSQSILNFLGLLQKNQQ